MEHTTLCNNTWLILWAVLYIPAYQHYISCRTLFMMFCAIQGSWDCEGAVLFLFHFLPTNPTTLNTFVQRFCFLIFLLVHAEQEIWFSSVRLNKRKSTWDWEETPVSLLTASLLNHPSIPFLHLPPCSTGSTLKQSEQGTPVPSPTEERKAATA